MPLEKLDEWQNGSTRRRTSGPARRGDRRDPARYGHLQSRRKPELLNRKITLDPAKNPATDSSAVVYDDKGTPFSLTAYQEMDRVTAEWQRSPRGPSRSASRLPDGYDDAYYQLVYYQVKATANLYALREAQFTNLLYASAGPGRHERPGRPGPGPVRRGPGDVRLLQQHAGRREVARLPAPAEDRVRRRGPVRPERALAAARTEQRGPAGRLLPAPAADRGAGSGGPGRRDRRLRQVVAGGASPGGAARRSARTRASRGSTSRCSTAARRRSTTPSGRPRRG